MATGFSIVRLNIILDVRFPDLPFHMPTRSILRIFHMSHSKNQLKTFPMMILSRYLKITSDKFALLWGEAQKKIAYCYPIMT